MTRAILFSLCAALVACSGTGVSTGGGGGGADLTTPSMDLEASADLASASADLAEPADLSTPDLAGYSGVGGPCGGFTTHPKQCLPGLVCVYHGVPDIPGMCEVPDGGACQPNGASCLRNSDCCSDNCILRLTPGYCCQPGGCP
jgi:hypothetical protein